MSLKNLMLVLFAAGAFAGAIFVATGPDPLRISYVMPIAKAPSR